MEWRVMVETLFGDVVHIAEAKISLADGGFGSEDQRHYWHVGVEDAEKIWGIWPEVYRGVVDCQPE